MPWSRKQAIAVLLSAKRKGKPALAEKAKGYLKKPKGRKRTG